MTQGVANGDGVGRSGGVGAQGGPGGAGGADPHANLVYDWNLQEQLRPEKRVTLDDETLRDGLQSPSCTNPKIEDKVKILHLMDELGIETANIGLPGAGAHVVEHTSRLAQEIAGARMKIRANCAA